MRKFVINTSSESGDHYTYLLKHSYYPASSEFDKFLTIPEQ